MGPVSGFTHRDRRELQGLLSQQRPDVHFPSKTKYNPSRQQCSNRSFQLTLLARPRFQSCTPYRPTPRYRPGPQKSCEAHALAGGKKKRPRHTLTKSSRCERPDFRNPSINTSKSELKTADDRRLKCRNLVGYGSSSRILLCSFPVAQVAAGTSEAVVVHRALDWQPLHVKILSY